MSSRNMIRLLVANTLCCLHSLQFIINLIYLLPSSCHSRDSEEKVKRTGSVHYTVSRFSHHAGCQKSFKNSILRLVLHSTVTPISWLVSWLPSTEYNQSCAIYIAGILSSHSSWMDLWYIKYMSNTVHNVAKVLQFQSKIKSFATQTN